MRRVDVARIRRRPEDLAGGCPSAGTPSRADNGIGIPVAEQRRLFDRFFRASTAQDRAIEGTGLGLTIVHAIVRAHGGAIEVASDEGQGTTFRVRLPVAGPAAEKVGSPDRSAETVI